MVLVCVEKDTVRFRPPRTILRNSNSLVSGRTSSNFFEHPRVTTGILIQRQEVLANKLQSLIFSLRLLKYNYSLPVINSRVKAFKLNCWLESNWLDCEECQDPVTIRAAFLNSSSLMLLCYTSASNLLLERSARKAIRTTTISNVSTVNLNSLNLLICMRGVLKVFE